MHAMSKDLSVPTVCYDQVSEALGEKIKDHEP